MEPSPAEDMLTTANLNGHLERIVRQVEAKIPVVTALTAELARISNRVDRLIDRLEPEIAELEAQRDHLIEQIEYIKSEEAPQRRKLAALNDMYENMKRIRGINLGSTSKGSSRGSSSRDN
jgi:chromosome segregation ATPase